MIFYLSSSLVFSTIEYFSYLNLWLIILFLFLCLFFLIFSSCQLLISSILCSGAVFEFSLIFLCFLFIVIIISPALIILLDSEIIIVPSFIVYSCGYQWAWTFSFYYLNWISNCDHYMFSSYYLSSTFLSTYSSSYNFISLIYYYIYPFNLSSINYIPYTYFAYINLYTPRFDSLNNPSTWISQLLLDDSLCFYLLIIFFIYDYFFIYMERGVKQIYNYWTIFINTDISNPSSCSLTTSLYLNFLSSLNFYCFYFVYLSTTLLIPILSTVSFFVFSYDVIHSLGIYSFGIKIDAIPGSFNFTSTISTLINGEHSGFCYELCGHGHSSMLIVGMVLQLLFIFYSSSLFYLI